MFSSDNSTGTSKQCSLFRNTGFYKGLRNSTDSRSVSTDAQDSTKPFFDETTENHDPELGSKNTQSKLYFGGYTLFEVFCIVLIALSGLSILILLLAWGPITTLQLKYWKESTSREFLSNNNGLKNLPQESSILLKPHSILPSPANNDSVFYSSPSEVKINSFMDFSNINEGTTGLKIESLKDSLAIVARNLKLSDKIQRLELLGPISREGLEMIFSTFKSIQYLYIDVDKVSWSYQSKKNPETMTLPQLTSIFLQNSEKTKFFDWPINLETPRLRKLKVVDAILNLENFNQLQKFVADAQETLEEIEITQCFICEECDLADVQYDNLVKITVNKRRTQETLEE